MDFLPLEKVKGQVMEDYTNDQIDHWMSEIYTDLDDKIEGLLYKNDALKKQVMALEEMILAKLGIKEGTLLIAKARSIEEEY
jgi:hypothetical protein